MPSASSGPNVLAANEYFNKQSQWIRHATPPSFHRYQEGGAIGGPIVKNKLFFFGDYEATQQQQFDGSNYFTVPTTAERTGDFSADSFHHLQPAGAGQSETAPGSHSRTTSFLIRIPSRLQFLSHLPKCNCNPYQQAAIATRDGRRDQQSLSSRASIRLKAHRFDVRVDWMQSEKQRIFGRFSYDQLFFSLFNAFDNMWDLNYAQNATNGRNVLLADDITINHSTVLQLRYSFTRHHENQGGDPRQNGFDITTLGFPSSLAAEQVYKTLPLRHLQRRGRRCGRHGKLEHVSVMPAKTAMPLSRITKRLGKHELSAGFEYMKRFLNVGQPPASSGWYSVRQVRNRSDRWIRKRAAATSRRC